MGEPEAIKAIKEGCVEINKVVYDVIPRPDGSCETCCFNVEAYCPQKALDICCTGGNVLWVKHN